MPVKCKICNNPIISYTSKKDTRLISKQYEIQLSVNALKTTKKSETRHPHYGNATYKYGICKFKHLTQFEQIKVDWLSCSICINNRTSIERKKKHLITKAKKSKMEVPSFLRKELDVFEHRMSARLEQKIEEQMGKVLDILKRDANKRSQTPTMFELLKKQEQNKFLNTVNKDFYDNVVKADVIESATSSARNSARDSARDSDCVPETSMSSKETVKESAPTPDVPFQTTQNLHESQTLSGSQTLKTSQVLPDFKYIGVSGNSERLFLRPLTFKKS